MGVDPNRVAYIRRPLLAKDIQHAQANTNSHAEAARFLHVSFSTYKRYAADYNLYENSHKNPSGKGISKKKTKGVFGLDEILAGKYPNYDRHKLKERMIHAGYLIKECSLCGHQHTRPDGRGPYLLSYKDGNTDNLSKDNLQLLCYNCTYLTTGRISVTPDDVSNPLADGRIYTVDTDRISAEDIEAIHNELIQD